LYAKSNKNLIFIIPLFWMVLLTACTSLLDRDVISEQAADRAVASGDIIQIDAEYDATSPANLIEVQRVDIFRTLNVWVTFDAGIIRNLHFGRHDARFKQGYVTVNDTFKKGDVLAVAEFDTRLVESELETLILTINQTNHAFERDQLQNQDILREMRVARHEITDEFELKTQNQRIQKQVLLNDNFLRQHENTMAELNERRIELSRALQGDKIIAPFDGVVLIERSLSQGAIVNPWDLVYSVIDPTKIQFVVTGGDISQVRYGDIFPATLANWNLDFDFKVVSDPLAANTRQGSYDFIVQPTDAKAFWEAIHELDVEYTDIRNFRFDGIVKIIELYDVLGIPTNALHYLDDAPYVFLYEDGNINIRFVEIGYSDNNNVQILAGLDEGQLIVRSR